MGIASIREDLPATATQAEVEAAVDRLNADPECTGFIVQLPLPAGVDTNAVLERIDPAKDADGLHPTNLGRLVLRVARSVDSPLPCTPRASSSSSSGTASALAGKHVVVVGRGTTVGRTIGLLLTRKAVNATVTLVPHRHPRPRAHTRTADVIVAAAGVPGIVERPTWSSGGVVLIDVGVSRVTDPETGKTRVVGRHRRPRPREGRVVLAEPGRRRADDAGDAAGKRRRVGGAPAG